ncbi:MAG: hypothetical protein WCF15_01170, partial [Pseudolabrys sp.]
HGETLTPPKRRPIGLCRQSFRANGHGGFPIKVRIKLSAGLLTGKLMMRKFVRNATMSALGH